MCDDSFYDTEDFMSGYMCCTCGGGDSDTNFLQCTDTDNGASNSYGYNCEDYANGNAEYAGTAYGNCEDYYDDHDFISEEVCCHCGGGLIECRDLDVQGMWDSLSFSCS